jgi:hypothetical protein
VTHYHACNDEDCHLANPAWQRLHMESASYLDYRWRSRSNPSLVQTALHPRYRPEHWVREARSVVKLTGEWKAVGSGPDAEAD